MREVRDQIENILIECVVLVEEVVQVNLTEEGQRNVAPNVKYETEPKKEVESAGSMMN